MRCVVAWIPQHPGPWQKQMGCSHSFANELFLKSYEEEPPSSIKSTVATRVWGSVRWHDCVCGAAGEGARHWRTSHTPAACDKDRIT